MGETWTIFWTFFVCWFIASILAIIFCSAVFGLIYYLQDNFC